MTHLNKFFFKNYVLKLIELEYDNEDFLYYLCYIDECLKIYPEYLEVFKENEFKDYMYTIIRNFLWEDFLNCVNKNEINNKNFNNYFQKWIENDVNEHNNYTIINNKLKNIINFLYIH